MTTLTADEVAAYIAEVFPQTASLALRIEALGAETIRVRMPVREEHLRPGGTVSGPTLVWLADCAMYMLVLSRIGRVPLAVTTNLNLDFLRRPSAPSLTAEGRLLKLGKRMAVGDVLLYAEGVDAPVARASLTYSIPPA